MSIRNNRAWLFVLPALLVMALNAFIPFITVINYSLQDILPGLPAIDVGMENFQTVLQDDLFRNAFVRQLGFSFLILLIEVPLGVAIALGWAAGAGVYSRIIPEKHDGRIFLWRGKWI